MDRQDACEYEHSLRGSTLRLPFSVCIGLCNGYRYATGTIRDTVYKRRPIRSIPLRTNAVENTAKTKHN
jgi:hypothetical protein